MAAAIVVEGPVLNGTIGVNRKISVRPYESAEASCFIQFEVDPANEAKTKANASAAFFMAKSLCFEELGLSFTVGENGIITEVLAKNFGTVTEVTQTAAPVSIPAPSHQGGGAGEAPPFAADTVDKTEKAANTKWAKERLATHPDEFWFNSPETKKNPKGPDYKSKAHGIALWI